MLNISKFVRRPFEVQAVRVTEELMPHIANWCNGEIKETQSSKDDSKPSKYVHVPVVRPVNERQTRAFVGDWVLSAHQGFKVFTDPAFRNTFIPGDGGNDYGSDQNLESVVNNVSVGTYKKFGNENYSHITKKQPDNEWVLVSQPVD